MLKKVGFAALLLFVAALVAPAAAPVQVSYVVSDSMSPTLATNDGYVLVDTGAVEAGDIITFYSEERGMSVTHRAVEVTGDGIVTQGDANPSTDQAAGYPLVQSDDVAGKVLTVGGAPLRIPQLGAVIALLRSYWYLTVALLAGVALRSLAGTARNRNRDSVLRSREIILTATVVAVIMAVVLVSFAATQQTTVYQVTANDTENAQTLTVGAERTEALTVRLARTPVSYAIVDTAGMTITNSTVVESGNGPRMSEAGRLGWLRTQLLEPEEQNVTATIPAQSATGPHRTSLRVHPYPRTLPRSVVTALHDVHPLVAAVSTVLVPVGLLYGLYWLLVDMMVPLRGTRSRRLRRLGGDR
jgi:signal peptidase I, archaeal type